MVKRTLYRKYIRLITRFVKFHILHVDDSAHRIALGVAIGLFCACLPPIGIHIVIALLLTLILRANKATAMIAVWANNPFTFVPIAVACFLIGRALFGIFVLNPELTAAQVTEMLRHHLAIGNIFTEIFTAAFWNDIGTLFRQIGIELMVGGVLLGIPTSVISYFLTKKFIIHHRLKKPRRRYRHLD